MFPFKKKAKQPTFAPLTPEQDAFLASCTAEYNEKLERLNRDWGFADYNEWGFDQISGLFWLSFNDGSKIEADAQIIGSFSTKGTSWEWAWANPHVAESMKREVSAVKEFGKKEGLEYLISPMVPSPDKIFASYLSGIAMKIMGSEGVFAGSTGSILVYLSLKNLRKKGA